MNEYRITYTYLGYDERITCGTFDSVDEVKSVFQTLKSSGRWENRDVRIEWRYAAPWNPVGDWDI